MTQLFVTLNAISLIVSGYLLLRRQVRPAEFVPGWLLAGGALISILPQSWAIMAGGWAAAAIGRMALYRRQDSRVI
jgi:hypothetical protein